MGSNSSKKEEIQQLESFRSYLDEKNVKVWGGQRRKEDGGGILKSLKEEGRRRKLEWIADEDNLTSNNCLFCIKFFKKPKPKTEVWNKKININMS